MKFPDINNMVANIEVALVAICMIRNTMNFIFNMPHTEQSKSSGKKGEREEAFMGYLSRIQGNPYYYL